MESSRPQKPKHTVVNMGISLMVVILVGLSLAVVAALSISSARNNYNMTNNLMKHTTEYYNASNEANKIIAQSNFADQDFEVPMGEGQILSVSVKGGEIVRFQVQNVSTWENDNFLPLM
ncbi:MAG: hypothetical protein HUJ98_01765 [Bacteroidaceae bacterium]|nr:hypothetical protein [Bacteroidaceae bacterium]